MHSSDGRRSDRQRSPVLPTLNLGEIRQHQPKEYLLRFALGTAISIVAGIIGKTVSARFGGAFLAFPSILPPASPCWSRRREPAALAAMPSAPSSAA